jgi:hypothetical protein
MESAGLRDDGIFQCTLAGLGHRYFVDNLVMYSQNDEERWILEALEGQTGTLLDIGAYNGRTRSNSLALIERGWGGVLVEPGLTPFRDLLDLHGGNENLKLVHALVGAHMTIERLWFSEDGLTTTSADNYRTWKEQANFSPIAYMPQVTILQLMLEFPALTHAEFVTIDAEGTSARIFLSWPMAMTKPKVFCVEHDNRIEELMEFAKGYRCVYQNGENIVMVRQ